MKPISKQDLENHRQLYDLNFKPKENDYFKSYKDTAKDKDTDRDEDGYIDYYKSHVYLETRLMYHQLNEVYKDFIKRHYKIIHKEK